MSDLVRAVRINEEVKSIVDASRAISIVALNAFLAARKSTGQSAGFSVVSRELRRLAGAFEAGMDGLDRIISELAGRLAQSIRDRRILAYIEATVATEDPHPCLWTTLEHVIAKHNAIDEAIATQWRKMAKDIGDLERLAVTGGLLARSAKIEAAYGGDVARILTQVADQVERAMREIVDRLETIRKLTNGESDKT